MEQNIDTSLLDRAIVFAVNAHKGVERKGKGFPYIVHPLEAVSIVATMSSDQELLAAAVLHDVIEDTPTTFEDLKQEFGERVARLVEAESDKAVKGPDAETWRQRKLDSLNRLRSADRDVKIVTIGDKLSNMRAIALDYQAVGDELWKRFTISNPAEHAWRYRALAEALSDLADTEAYKEFCMLVDKTFGNIS